MCWHKWSKWKLTNIEYTPERYDITDPRSWGLSTVMTTPAQPELVEIQQRECEKCGRIQRASFY